LSPRWTRTPTCTRLGTSRARSSCTGSIEILKPIHDGVLMGGGELLEALPLNRRTKKGVSLAVRNSADPDVTDEAHQGSARARRRQATFERLLGERGTRRRTFKPGGLRARYAGKGVTANKQVTAYWPPASCKIPQRSKVCQPGSRYERPGFQAALFPGGSRCG
jgi:hypothetical protein